MLGGASPLRGPLDCFGGFSAKFYLPNCEESLGSKNLTVRCYQRQAVDKSSGADNSISWIFGIGGRKRDSASASAGSNGQYDEAAFHVGQERFERDG